MAHQYAQPLDTIGQRSGYRRDQTILQWCADALRSSPAPRRHLDVGCAYGNMIFMLHAAVEGVAVSSSSASTSTTKHSSTHPRSPSACLATRTARSSGGCHRRSPVRGRMVLVGLHRRCDRAPRVPRRGARRALSGDPPRRHRGRGDTPAGVAVQVDGIRPQPVDARPAVPAVLRRQGHRARRRGQPRDACRRRARPHLRDEPRRAHRSRRPGRSRVRRCRTHVGVQRERVVRSEATRTGVRARGGRRPRSLASAHAGPTGCASASVANLDRQGGTGALRSPTMPPSSAPRRSG